MYMSRGVCKRKCNGEIKNKIRSWHCMRHSYSIHYTIFASKSKLPGVMMLMINLQTNRLSDHYLTINTTKALNIFQN